MEQQDFSELRYEKKFIINNELVPREVEHLIKYNPGVFSEIYHERAVNNIYLDSFDLSNYRENVSGNANRIKIRIRWYGELFGFIKEPVLEVKIKKNELGKKLQFKLRPFVFHKKISFNMFKLVFKDSDLPGWLIARLKLYHPTLLNTYKRKYFISIDKKYRITFDKNMTFYRIKNKNNLFIDKIENRNISVLEVKYSLKDYKKAQEITNFFPFRLSAHSKYVKGIDILEL